MGSSHLFTSECVGAGHPDKVCDQISDAIVDAILAEDKNARIACETCATTGQVVLMGEVKTSAKGVLADVGDIARQTIREIGYTNPAFGIDADSCGIFSAIHSQSPDINQGVDRSEGEQGAGDQGMMFGYACDETPELMPLPMQLSRQLANRIWDKRQSGEIAWLRPDCKTQVTVEYDSEGIPTRLDTIVISTQHDEDVSHAQIREAMIEEIVKPLLPEHLVKGEIKYHVNPTGRFVIGGPHGDSGLTGRKIIVDTYGGMGRHGGGAFSGKDPSKVDRSAAYATRWIAKNIVAAGLAKRCELQVAYAIGVAEPVSMNVNTFGTGTLSDDRIEAIVRETVSLKPAAIIKELDLLRPIYLRTARFGHMGREDDEVSWEQRTLSDAFKAKA
ncbi:MAG: methionine adenosyltransferase [Planctomycetes bacterium]|nr:methionine adenosyltransferase [Planctomycetota bacterium]